jgi:inorganic triphosphatase YgiF
MAKETELALAVIAEDPEAVVARVAGLSRIGAFRLSSPAELLMHDTYYGRPGSEFEAKQMALRVREVGAKRLITMKGPVLLNRDGVRERLELEMPWSRQSLDQALAVLSSNRLRVKQDDLFEEDSPESTLTGLGFRVVQRRSNRRMTREVASHDEPEQVLAELAIDTVVYELDPYLIHHHEVEVESKSEPGKHALATICRDLYDIFEELRRWGYGKLVTGRAIEKLLGKKEIDAQPGEEYLLKPADYDTIRRQLDRT